MASPYELFGTDTKSEKDGIILDFGEFWLRIARAGGANKKFGRVLDAKMQPHRRAMQSGTLDDDLATRRSEEHTSELQSLMRISYAVFCLKTKNQVTNRLTVHNTSKHIYQSTINTT